MFVSAVPECTAGLSVAFIHVNGVDCVEPAAKTTAVERTRGAVDEVSRRSLMVTQVRNPPDCGH